MCEGLRFWGEFIKTWVRFLKETHFFELVIVSIKTGCANQNKPKHPKTGALVYCQNKTELTILIYMCVCIVSMYAGICHLDLTSITTLDNI